MIIDKNRIRSFPRESEERERTSKKFRIPPKNCHRIRKGLGQTLLLSFSLFLCYAERVGRVGHTNPAKGASRTIGGCISIPIPKIFWAKILMNSGGLPPHSSLPIYP
jgi:hypothetical protein